MPLPALEQGIDWKWETFAEYLDRLEGNIAVNAGFLVGHCAIRRYVMGADADRRRGDARADRRDARASSATRIEAGGARLLDHAVDVALRRRRPARRRPLGHARRAPRAVRGDRRSTRAPRSRASCTGCLDQFSDDEIELLGAMSAAADRPLNWNVLTVDAREPERVPRQLGAGDRGRELGGRIVALDDAGRSCR